MKLSLTRPQDLKHSALYLLLSTLLLLAALHYAKVGIEWEDSQQPLEIRYDNDEMHTTAESVARYNRIMFQQQVATIKAMWLLTAWLFTLVAYKLPEPFNRTLFAATPLMLMLALLLTVELFRPMISAFFNAPFYSFTVGHLFLSGGLFCLLLASIYWDFFRRKDIASK